MSIFVEPLLDQLKLIGEEDPEEPKKLTEASASVDQPDEKGFFENLTEYMDVVFLKHPRSTEIDMTSELSPKRLSNLEETLKPDSDYEKIEELSSSENTNRRVQAEDGTVALDSGKEIDKGTSYAL
jgi:hypothetical protein